MVRAEELEQLGSNLSVLSGRHEGANMAHWFIVRYVRFLNCALERGCSPSSDMWDNAERPVTWRDLR